MARKPKFPSYSVLMSVYYKENPEWLKISINSMLKQTAFPSEFVLVEDGPLTDELDKVIEKYQKKYKDLFKIVKLKTNQGLGPALKIGVENCTNEYIARMDSDDYSIPTRCEKELEKIVEDNDLDIVGSNVAEFIDNIENVQAYRMLPETNEDIHKYAKRRNPFGHPSVMLRKSKVIEAGNYREYYLCEDYDLWLRMIEKGAKCYNFKEILVYMRVSPDFYKRRGGIKYLKSILKFKTEQFKKKRFKFGDYVISSCASIVACLCPNVVREFIYKKLLRK